MREALIDAESTPAGECLTDDEVLGFVEGWLGPLEIIRVDGHTGVCTKCATLIVETLCGRSLAKPSADTTWRCWSFQSGSCIADRYIVRRPLGGGGMGDVYEAFDLRLHRSVALKTACATVCDSPEANDRISMEGEIARRVRHQNVRRIYDAGNHCDAHPCGAGVAFLSMELIEGESLAERLRRGPLPLEEFMILAREILLGLSAIHSMGIVHRDIKSQNLMLRPRAPNGSVVIIDFGLAVDAMRLSMGSFDGASESSSFEGSPAYMAPEQFFVGPIAPSIDIFAYGVVLFQSLTGGLPFTSLRADRSKGTRRNPHEAPMRIQSIIPGLPARLAAFINRCLRVDVAERYADAAAALGDLRVVLNALDADALSVQPS